MYRNKNTRKEGKAHNKKNKSLAQTMYEAWFVRDTFCFLWSFSARSSPIFLRNRFNRQWPTRKDVERCDSALLAQLDWFRWTIASAAVGLGAKRSKSPRYTAVRRQRSRHSHHYCGVLLVNSGGEVGELVRACRTTRKHEKLHFLSMDRACT